MRITLVEQIQGVRIGESMTKENYVKMTQPFRENEGLARGIHIANKLCTGIMYLAYPILLVYLFFFGKLSSYFSFERALLVPAISFVLLSVFRKWVNRPRPYEKQIIAQS